MTELHVEITDLRANAAGSGSRPHTIDRWPPIRGPMGRSAATASST